MSFPLSLRQTFAENWPPTLTLAAVPSEEVALSQHDARVLGSMSRVFRAELGDWRIDGFSPAFEPAITKALANLPEGVMPRIGYCSWKGSTLVNAPARTLAEVMRIITADDPRVGSALSVMCVSRDPVVLHLRAWRDIPAWAEFRLFVRRKQLVGMSQYDWRSRHPEIPRQHAAIVTAVNALLAEIWDDLHMDDVVIDVFVTAEGDGLRATLIELNPMESRTDACLFSWNNGGDFDGSFRYAGQVAAHHSAQGHQEFEPRI